MPIKKITFKILRYKPGHIDPPRFQEFKIEADPNTSVLDGLEKIRLEQDKTLMYRHSCHHASCGTCACKINGAERLTCITRPQDLQTDTITLTPLEGFKPIGDLVVSTPASGNNYSDTMLLQFASSGCTLIRTWAFADEDYDLIHDGGECFSAYSHDLTVPVAESSWGKIKGRYQD